MATQKGSEKNNVTPRDTQVNSSKKQPANTQEYDELMEESDKERTKKPGSQSTSSGQDNNGRGGGK